MRITRQQWNQVHANHRQTVDRLRNRKGSFKDLDYLDKAADLMNQLFEEIAMLDATILKIATAANDKLIADQQAIAAANQARDAAQAQAAQVPQLQQQLADAQTALAAANDKASQNAVSDATVQAITTLGNTLGIAVDAPANPAPAPQPAQPATPQTATGPVLRNANGILTTPAGNTLYVYSGTAAPDTTVWTPYLVPSAPTGADGLGAVPLQNGSLLATSGGEPLYTLAGEQPGQVTGDGRDGNWAAVRV